MKIEIQTEDLARLTTETLHKQIQEAITGSWELQTQVRKEVEKAFQAADVPGRIGRRVLELLNTTIEQHVEDVVSVMLPTLKSGAKLLAQEMVVTTLRSIAIGERYVTEDDKKTITARLCELVKGGE